MVTLSFCCTDFTVLIRDKHRELTKMPITHRQPKLGSKEDIALIQLFILSGISYKGKVLYGCIFKGSVTFSLISCHRDSDSEISVSAATSA